MKVLKAVGSWVVCGAATTLGALLIQKGVSVVSKSGAKAKLSEAFTCIKDKLKRK